MALTTVEETQVRDLLIDYEGLKDVGADSADIIATLVAGDVLVIDLPTASPLNAADVLYVAQAGDDVKATIQQIADFSLTLIPVPPIPYDRTRIYYMGQI